MNTSIGRPSGRSLSVFLMLAIMAVALPAWPAGGRSALAPRGGAEARDDAYRATTNQPLIIVAPGVLTNDTATSTNQLGAALSAPPAHGTVSLSADGGFEYTPDADFVGLDSFRYTLTGGGDGYA